MTLFVAPVGDFLATQLAHVSPRRYQEVTRKSQWAKPPTILTEKGSSGLTMARPRATAIDLCRHKFVLPMAVLSTVITTSQDWRWPRQFLRAAHVLLPDDLTQTQQDLFNVLFNELDAKNHGTDKLSETRNRSNRRTPPLSTYRFKAYFVTRRLLFASQMRGSVVNFSA